MQRSLPIYWVDAFARRTFSGNPAAVIPLEEWLEDDVLQSIAFENGLSETAFVSPLEDGLYELRWFTPTAEVDLCGHATIATAFALKSCCGESRSRLSFRSRSGMLHVTFQVDGRLQLDFPSRPPKPAVLPNEIVMGLGAKPTAFLRAEANLAIYDSADDVAALCPDFSQLAALPEYGTIATAPGTDCDFVSRFFAPSFGIPEDPATGSAHCILAPYWVDRLGKNQLYARQISKRGAELWCELSGDRVHISGYATLYLKGHIHI